MTIRFLLMLFALLSFGSADATVYYCDYQNGNDSNGGTSWGDAKKTIDAFTTINAGDEIRVAKTPDPSEVGTATWTNLSATVTFQSTPTGLTTTDLISKDGIDWWPIASINGTTVNLLSAFVGTTGTAMTSKRTPVSNVNGISVKVAGINITGGWDTSAGTQNGETWLDGVSTANNKTGLSVPDATITGVSIEKIALVRYKYGTAALGNNWTLDIPEIAGCYNAALFNGLEDYYADMDYQLGGMIANGLGAIGPTNPTTSTLVSFHIERLYSNTRAIWLHHWFKASYVWIEKAIGNGAYPEEGDPLPALDFESFRGSTIRVDTVTNNVGAALYMHSDLNVDCIFGEIANNTGVGVAIYDGVQNFTYDIGSIHDNGGSAAIEVMSSGSTSITVDVDHISNEAAPVKFTNSANVSVSVVWNLAESADPIYVGNNTNVSFSSGPIPAASIKKITGETTEIKDRSGNPVELKRVY